MMLAPIVPSHGWAEVHHVLYRESLHLIGSAAAYLGMMFGLYGLKYKFKQDYYHWTMVFLPALFVCFLAFLREPSDVHRGDLWYKSYIDLGGWVIGAVVTGFIANKVLRKFE
jgi:hypothetical protein